MALCVYARRHVRDASHRTWNVDPQPSGASTKCWRIGSRSATIANGRYEPVSPFAEVTMSGTTPS